MVRKERLTKIVNILSYIYPEQFLLDKTPSELENLFYQIMTQEREVTKLYLEKYYDKKGNQRIDKEIPKTE